MGNRIFNLQRFLAILKKEFIQLRRDSASLRLSIFMPVVLMFLFGYAVDTQLNKIPTIVFDQNKSAESREYTEKFAASDYFDIKFNVSGEKEMYDLIDNGDAKAAIIIPANYSNDIKANRNPQTQLVIDGTDPTTARTALNSGVLISEVYSRDVIEKKMQKIGSSLNNINGVTLSSKVLNNPDLSSQRFMVPAVIGVILQNLTIMLTAFTLVREKERGTIEQLIVTPMKRTELILGKLVPYIIISYAGFLMALFLSIYWFGVNVSGSFPLLLIMGVLISVCFLSVGILISTIARNQLQAMMMTVVTFLPSVLLSGFIYPREAMPIVIRCITYIIPLTYALDIIRGIIVKGVGMRFLWTDVATLFLFTIFLLSLAILRFRKSLD